MSAIAFCMLPKQIRHQQQGLQKYASSPIWKIRDNWLEHSIIIIIIISNGTGAQSGKHTSKPMQMF
jgi:hypothetical protein